MTTKKEIDYLTEDPTISEQKYMCISFLKPSSVDAKNKPKNLTVCGVKIRGSYSTYEEAKARADFLQKCDQYHNIYIGEVGKWCPFEDNPEKAKDSEYMNKDLNKLMKSYWKQQSDAKEHHEIRKQEMIKKAMDEVNKKKKEKKEKINHESDSESDSEKCGIEEHKANDQGEQTDQNILNSTSTDNLTTDQDDNVSTKLSKSSKSSKLSKSTKSTKSKLSKLSELKSDLDANKIDLEKEKRDVDENINTLRRLEEELSEKIKEMELENIRSAHLNSNPNLNLNSA
jgi:hypothetical protein